jgi:hypothetical protein
MGMGSRGLACSGFAKLMQVGWCLFGPQEARFGPRMVPRINLFCAPSCNASPLADRSPPMGEYWARGSTCSYEKYSTALLKYLRTYFSELVDRQTDRQKMPINTIYLYEAKRI